jgi:bifunctional UDP-N-acetylglucosamine pyrophosphorylase/glucosamine-1-phosphate N-acetyltransferase
MERTAIILAAGLGTRMKSALPKAAHPIAGQPMLTHLINACTACFSRIVVVSGPGMTQIEALAAPHDVVVQTERLGTAHAALQAAAHFGTGPVAILYADNPLISPATLAALAARLAQGDAQLVLLGMTPPDPGRYGRIISNGAYVERIVEYADASAADRAVGLCNAGGLMAHASDMARWLAAVRPDNEKGEYYLTDIVVLARAEGAKVAALDAPFAECRGINSRAELAAAEAGLQEGLRAAAMDEGVAMQAPETVFLAADTKLDADVSIGPYVVFGPGVQVARGAQIKAFSHLEGCRIEAGAIIGPYARIRPGSVIGAGAHIGNFCETKAADIGPGAKVNHLSYIGDAAIGARTNIGAGTITCNYDGTHKHKTMIGADVFVGSDTALVAPVTVGDHVIIGAGSVITENIEADSLAIARGRQVTKPGRGTRSKPARRA